jgi:hypothetical protein
MATTRTEVSDQRKTGLTLADVEEVCAKARAAGATGAELVGGTFRWNGTLTKMSVGVGSGATKEDVR